MDGIIATGFNPTVAAASILTEWHKDPRHRRIQFIGIDTDPTVLRAIRDGNINGTVAQNPFAHGYVSCALLELLNEGWKPRREYAFINAGSIVVTKENLDTYTAALRQSTDLILAELKTRYLLPPK